jgi:predicted transcriptional regulator
MDGMVGKAQLSLRVPLDVVESFDRIAKALDRDRSWVMLRALRLYLEGEGAELAAEAAGLAALDRGESVDFDSVLDEAAALIPKPG